MVRYGLLHPFSCFSTRDVPSSSKSNPSCMSGRSWHKGSDAIIQFTMQCWQNWKNSRGATHTQKQTCMFLSALLDDVTHYLIWLGLVVIGINCGWAVSMHAFFFVPGSVFPITASWNPCECFQHIRVCVCLKSPHSAIGPGHWTVV